MRGWKGSRETRLLTICHSCHGCLLLSFLSCRDANSGLGGQSSISEENGLFIHCHRVARYALHWNLACDLHCATKLLKISCFHPLQVTVCWGHHMYALWTPRWQFDNTQFTRQGHAEVMVSNFFTPYYNFPFLSFLHFFPVILLLSLTCVVLCLITLTFPFLYFLLSMLSTSGGIHWCTLCTLPTQHPSCVPYLTAVRLPLGVFEVIPSCSGTARWCCWSAAPWRGGWHPARAPRTRSPAGPTAAGEGFGPSGWWVGPHRPEWEFPLSEGAEGSPVKKKKVLFHVFPAVIS